MPQARLSMRKIREVLRLRWQQRLSYRQIAASCRLGLGAVGEYVRRASAAGLSRPLPEGLADAELERRLFPPPQAIAPTDPKAYGYSRFCELYREWRAAAEPRM